MNEKGKYTYDWPRPMVTADAIVFAIENYKTKLLMIKRGHEPYKGMWAFPGGFLEMDEELDQAVKRELAEETSLIGIELTQLITVGTIGRDPRGRQITVIYTGLTTPDNMKVTAGDDADEAKWFDIENLPENIAFDHEKIARLAIEKMNSQNAKA